MIGQIRQRTKPALKAVAKAISFLPLSPNQFTFLAVPLSATAAYFLATENYIIGAVFVVLSILIDFLDGSYAEAKGKKSYFGNYFDAVIDKVVEAFLYLGLAFNYPLLAFICFATTMLVSYAKPRVALVIETDNRDWSAIGERADRLILLILGVLTVNFVRAFDVLQITLIIIASVTLVGFIQRVLYARKLIKEAAKKGKILPYLKKKKK